jgi:hypothetical protein
MTDPKEPCWRQKLTIAALSGIVAATAKAIISWLLSQLTTAGH